mgnify:FL=1
MIVLVEVDPMAVFTAVLQVVSLVVALEEVFLEVALEEVFLEAVVPHDNKLNLETVNPKTFRR